MGTQDLRDSFATPTCAICRWHVTAEVTEPAPVLCRECEGAMRLHDPESLIAFRDAVKRGEEADAAMVAVWFRQSRAGNLPLPPTLVDD